MDYDMHDTQKNTKKTYKLTTIIYYQTPFSMARFIKSVQISRMNGLKVFWKYF